MNFLVSQAYESSQAEMVGPLVFDSVQLGGQGASDVYNTWGQGAVRNQRIWPSTWHKPARRAGVIGNRPGLGMVTGQDETVIWIGAEIRLVLHRTSEGAAAPRFPVSSMLPQLSAELRTVQDVVHVHTPTSGSGYRNVWVVLLRGGLTYFLNNSISGGVSFVFLTEWGKPHAVGAFVTTGITLHVAVLFRNHVVRFTRPVTPLTTGAWVTVVSPVVTNGPGSRIAMIDDIRAATILETLNGQGEPVPQNIARVMEVTTGNVLASPHQMTHSVSADTMPLRGLFMAHRSRIITWSDTQICMWDITAGFPILRTFTLDRPIHWLSVGQSRRTELALAYIGAEDMQLRHLEMTSSSNLPGPLAPTTLSYTAVRPFMCGSSWDPDLVVRRFMVVTEEGVLCDASTTNSPSTSYISMLIKGFGALGDSGFPTGAKWYVPKDMSLKFNNGGFFDGPVLAPTGQITRVEVQKTFGTLEWRRESTVRACMGTDPVMTDGREVAAWTMGGPRCDAFMEQYCDRHDTERGGAERYQTNPVCACVRERDRLGDLLVDHPTLKGLPPVCYGSQCPRVGYRFRADKEQSCSYQLCETLNETPAGQALNNSGVQTVYCGGRLTVTGSAGPPPPDGSGAEDRSGSRLREQSPPGGEITVQAPPLMPPGVITLNYAIILGLLVLIAFSFLAFGIISYLYPRPKKST